MMKKMKKQFFSIVIAGMVLLACSKKSETPDPFPPIVLTEDQTAACYVNDTVTNPLSFAVIQYDSSHHDITLGFRVNNSSKGLGCVINMTTRGVIDNIVLNEPLKVSMTYKKLLPKGSIDRSQEWNSDCLSRPTDIVHDYADMKITSIDSTDDSYILSGTFSGRLCSTNAGAKSILGGVFRKVALRR
jgi:hypothetical protein